MNHKYVFSENTCIVEIHGEEVDMSHAKALFEFLLYLALRAKEDQENHVPTAFAGILKADDWEREVLRFTKRESTEYTDLYQLAKRLRDYFITNPELKNPLKSFGGGYRLDTDPKNIQIPKKYLEQWKSHRKPHQPFLPIDNSTL